MKNPLIEVLMLVEPSSACEIEISVRFRPKQFNVLRTRWCIRVLQKQCRESKRGKSTITSMMRVCWPSLRWYARKPRG